MSKLIIVLFLCLMMLIQLTANAAAKQEKILFIPHDARPVSYQQTAEVLEQLDYEIIMPPKEFFGTTKTSGQIDELWNWFEDNVTSADAAVVASDSLLYGGLIPSRKHDISQATINSRFERFKNLKTNNPNLKIYVFASLMRTPESVPVGFDEEPDYYPVYGTKIFRLTELADKQEISRLSNDEYQKVEYLKKSIPDDILNDYFERRAKNLAATKKFIDFLNDGIIDYLVIGRDDNAPLSQTHKENRELLAYAEIYNLPKTKFQSLAGIDEFNLLLLTHAVNDIRGENPTINVKFNKGKGAATIPAYSDEPIGLSIQDAVTIAGGNIVDEPDNADFVLLVNTDWDGRTYHAHNALPDSAGKFDTKKLQKSAAYFSDIVNDYINAGYPVGIADITFANGADNALMDNLYDRGLLFKLQAYSGWNTATNSTGFAIGTGILAKYMSNESKDKLLLRRYLDDWAYQANVRTAIGEQLFNARESNTYYNLGDKALAVEDRVTTLMRDFAETHLPPFEYLRGFYVTLPWNRMFECDIHLAK